MEKEAKTIDMTPTWATTVSMYKMVIDSNVANILDSAKKLQQGDFGFDPLVAIADYQDEIIGSAEAINKTMNDFSIEMTRIAQVIDELNNETAELQNLDSGLDDEAKDMSEAKENINESHEDMGKEKEGR